MASLTLTVVGIGAIIALVGMSAFFSSSETALFTLTDDWLTDQAQSDDRRMATLQSLQRDPHRLLVTILLGNNVVNIAIASATTVLCLEYLPAGGAVTAATLLASFVVLIFGEIVPKSYGLGHAQQWALSVAVPLAVIGRVLSPLVSVFDAVTRWMNARIGGEGEIERPYVD